MVFRRICLVMIGCYQSFLSPFLGRSCRYYPSCSEYARQLFYFQHPCIAFLKTFFRILSCNQFFKGGVAYPRVVLQFSIRFCAPCLIEYWIVPCETSLFSLRDSLVCRISTPIQVQAYIIKNYSKVSRVS